MLTAILVGAAIVGGVTAVGAGVGAATGATVHRVKTGSWEGAGQAAISGAKTGAIGGAVVGAGIVTGGAALGAVGAAAAGTSAAAGAAAGVTALGAAAAGGIAAGGAAIGAAVTGATAKTLAVGAAGGIIGTTIANSRTGNNTSLQTGTPQPGDPDFIGPVQNGTTGGTQEADFTTPYGIGETGAFPTATAGEGAEIAELKRQIGRFIDETNTLSRSIAESAEILNNMAVTINADSDLGKGLRNLAIRTQNLGAEADTKLEYLATFMNERVSAAETGIAESSATLDSLAGRLNNLEI